MHKDEEHAWHEQRPEFKDRESLKDNPEWEQTTCLERTGLNNPRRAHTHTQTPTYMEVRRQLTRIDSLHKVWFLVGWLVGCPELPL